LGKKLTLITQKTTYHIKHYDLDDETIIKEFGSIEEFEQYEDLNSFLVSSEFVDEHTVKHHMDEMEYYVGHKVINDRGIISEKE
tara:strand:- start:73 stop:324 length:252 start_codon:yes stop_codon:yes gene_type:complete